MILVRRALPQEAYAHFVSDTALTLSDPTSIGVHRTSIEAVSQEAGCPLGNRPLFPPLMIYAILLKGIGLAWNHPLRSQHL